MPKKQMMTFLFFLAASVICNYRRFSTATLPETPDQTIVFLGMLVFACLLFNTHSRYALIAACTAGLIIPIEESYLSNHEILYLGLVVTMLATYGFSMIRERRLRVDLTAYHETLASLIRIEFCAFYFWVAFHKVNPHFFDSATTNP